MTSTRRRQAAAVASSIAYRFISANLSGDPDHPLGHILGDGLVTLSSATPPALADDVVTFTIQSPKWGKVEFTFDGLKACAKNKGEKMCGTADKVPQPGEDFTLTWPWPQKKWTRQD